MNERAWTLVLIGLAAAGCAPADVAGSYTVNVTNGENQCEVDGWDTGGMATGIPLTVTQDEHDVELRVEGVTGGLLTLVLGDRTFVGTVAGNGIDAEIIGSNSATEGRCTYTYTVQLEASLDGDFLRGDLIWRANTNGHADCGVLETCRNRQSFNGSRPPR